MGLTSETKEWLGKRRLRLQCISEKFAMVRESPGPKTVLEGSCITQECSSSCNCCVITSWKHSRKNVAIVDAAVDVKSQQPDDVPTSRSYTCFSWREIWAAHLHGTRGYFLNVENLRYMFKRQFLSGSLGFRKVWGAEIWGPTQIPPFSVSGPHVFQTEPWSYCGRSVLVERAVSPFPVYSSCSPSL